MNQVALVKFFEFTQNNSGGSFDVDDKVCHRLFIEAVDEKQAISIAESLGVYFDGCEKGMDCECCGDRWSSYTEEITFPYEMGIKFTTVEEYAQFLADKYGWTTPDARIFYLNGVVKEIYKPSNRDSL